MVDMVRTPGLEFIELSRQDADPAVACDRGVSLIPAIDRQHHAPDRSLLLIDRGSLVARCSCWWADTAVYDGRSLGVIGHYAAADADRAGALLARACEVLAANGCATAVGPMDGTTWRRYRFIVDRGAEPTFFLEPDNPDDWPEHWTRAGFAPLAAYVSAINDDLGYGNSRTNATRARLADAGISIRPLDLSQADAELRRIFALSLRAFSRNFLYTPIGEEEFLAQNKAVLPYVQPELVLLAEKQNALVGFVFALPDILQARRGIPIDTVVMKTLAVDPSAAGVGLGSALLEEAQQVARRRGFRRVIHALIHEGNVSRRISDRYARTIRRYALYARALA
jgi:ribosomal protein S18 acetylase RimI-like enzyme